MRKNLKIMKVRHHCGIWTSVPVFIVVMSFVIWMSVDVLGVPLQRLLYNAITSLGSLLDGALTDMDVSAPIRSLVVDAVFGGVGAVVSFVPVIALLFFFLTLLEDSGYMDAAAGSADRMMRRAGLSGRCLLPLIVGFGCSVPAVMAIRDLPSETERNRTAMLLPFVSCSAKIPMYVLFASVLFPGHGGLAIVCIYLLSLLVGLVAALVSARISSSDIPALPPGNRSEFRAPRLEYVLRKVALEAWDFLRRVFTVVFIATVIIWVLRSFDWRFTAVEDPSLSMLASIGDWLVPVFTPLGLGDWKVVITFISGFLAKENIVSTMELLGLGSGLPFAAGLAMLVFGTLYSPCIATIASVRREFGRGRGLGMFIFQCAVAWLVAFLVYRLALPFV